MAALPRLRLKVRVRGRHPWFYRKMVARPDPPIPAGSAVQVFDRESREVGVGFYNPRSQLALRMIARQPVGDVDAALVALLDAAIALREDVLGLPKVTDAYRIAHAEGDGLPALILDRLGDAVVAQVGCLGIHRHLEPLGEHLLQRDRRLRLVLTVDADAAKREGIPWTAPPPAREVEVVEHGARFGVVPGHGHKTGFFADQRDHRRRLRSLARRRRVLDLFCNSGGFAVHAALGGAKEVVAADLDEHAVALAADNARRNDVRIRCEHADAFDVLRALRPGTFDVVVLDPPKWAHGRDEVEAALPRYLDVNRLALERLPAGGLLVTSSCSGAVSEALFLDTLRHAAAAAGRDVRLLHVGGAGPDHPVALECPETRYLDTVFAQVR